MGIAIYFLGRFSKRRNKTKANLVFWLKDNWVELLQTYLINAAFMIILMMPQVIINIDKFVNEYVPFDVVVVPLVAKMVISFLLGWVFTAIIYRIVKSKK